MLPRKATLLVGTSLRRARYNEVPSDPRLIMYMLGAGVALSGLVCCSTRPQKSAAPLSGHVPFPSRVDVKGGFVYP